MNPPNINQAAQLIYINEAGHERVIVEFEAGDKGKARFSNASRIFEETMKGYGIRIPVAEKKDYPELKPADDPIIYPQHPSFKKVFFQSYKYYLRPAASYRWKVL